MRVLLVKMTSMGDVVHALPALTDAMKALPDVSFDWVVEEGFSEIPYWHYGVDRVIPVALRRWRKEPIKSFCKGEWKDFLSRLRARKYDAIIDAQGLLKSAFVACMAKGPRFGLNKNSAKESLSAKCYHFPQEVPWNLHAVERIRRLFALSLDYTLPLDRGEYRLNKKFFLTNKTLEVSPYVVFVHGASKSSKFWPEDYWCQLAGKVISQDVKVYFPWGTQSERCSANRMAAVLCMNRGELYQKNICVLSKMTLTQLAQLFIGAKVIVSVDTGLGHIAAALNVPVISIYCITSPEYVGTYGDSTVHLASEYQQDKNRPMRKLSKNNLMYSSVTVRHVWQKVSRFLEIL